MYWVYGIRVTWALEMERIRHNLETRLPICLWRLVRDLRDFWRACLTSTDDIGCILNVDSKCSYCVWTSACHSGLLLPWGRWESQEPLFLTLWSKHLWMVMKMELLCRKCLSVAPSALEKSWCTETFRKEKWLLLCYPGASVQILGWVVGSVL